MMQLYQEVTTQDGTSAVPGVAYPRSAKLGVFAKSPQDRLASAHYEYHTQVAIESFKQESRLRNRLQQAAMVQIAPHLMQVRKPYVAFRVGS